MNNLVVLDADGVLLNYNDTFAKMYEEAFGVAPQKQAAEFYHAANQYEMPHLANSAAEKMFYELFDQKGWDRMKAMPGSIEATQQMVQKGWRLVCLTSMPARFVAERIKNFEYLGMPISHTYVAERKLGEPTAGKNPKAKLINELGPAYFVDDLADNFLHITCPVKKVLLHRNEPDNPNVELLHRADIVFPTLLDFVEQLPMVTEMDRGNCHAMD